MNWPIEEIAMVLDFPGEFETKQEATKKSLRAKATRLIARDVQANIHLRIAVPEASDDSAIGEIIVLSWGSSSSI
jgi:hypothetical protein